MSLQVASAYNSFTWAQQQLNPGFSASYQGPDTFAYATNFTIDSTGVNTVFAEQDTLGPLVSKTFDLTDLLDFFNNPINATRVYSIQLGTTDTDLQLTPGASDPCQFFFMDNSDGILVKAGSDMMYNSSYPFTVDASNKNITIFNTSATTTTTYKIALILGQGAGTTTTTTTTATTSTSTTSTTSSTTTSTTTT